MTEHVHIVWKTIISWINQNLEKCESPKVEPILKYQSILESMEQNVTEGGKALVEIWYYNDSIYNIYIFE